MNQFRSLDKWAQWATIIGVIIAIIGLWVAVRQGSPTEPEVETVEFSATLEALIMEEGNASATIATLLEQQTGPHNAESVASDGTATALTDKLNSVEATSAALSEQITHFQEQPRAHELEAPVDFVGRYYTLINERNYYTAWSLLSRSFQSTRNPNGFDEYRAWWDSVDAVSVERATLRSQLQYTAIVEVELRFHMRAGNVTPYFGEFTLRWSTPENAWRIDEVVP